MQSTGAPRQCARRRAQQVCSASASNRGVREVRYAEHSRRCAQQAKCSLPKIAGPIDGGRGGWKHNESFLSSLEAEMPSVQKPGGICRLKKKTKVSCRHDDLVGLVPRGVPWATFGVEF